MSSIGHFVLLVSVVAKLDHLPRDRFLTFLDNRNWLHPYDAEGERRPLKDLPKHLDDLADDPYRSLAGEVRRAGGYARARARRRRRRPRRRLRDDAVAPSHDALRARVVRL